MIEGLTEEEVDIVHNNPDLTDRVSAFIHRDCKSWFSHLALCSGKPLFFWCKTLGVAEKDADAYAKVMERAAMADGTAKLTQYVASGFAAASGFFEGIGYYAWRKNLSAKYTAKVAKAVSMRRRSSRVPEKCLAPAAAYCLEQMQKRIRFLLAERHGDLLLR
jgi:hypothetical protein